MLSNVFFLGILEHRKSIGVIVFHWILYFILAHVTFFEFKSEFDSESSSLEFEGDNMFSYSGSTNRAHSIIS